MGKDGENEGDILDETTSEVSPLDDPTTKLEYDLFANMNDPEHRAPNFVHTFAREQHGPSNPRWQESYTYSDGFGREIQTKIQAEPGPLDLNDPNLPFIDPRWVGTGWTIFNNKGEPIKKYEPFFSPTHEFEFGKQVGVSSTLFYDPLERVVATLHPNHTYEKVVFDPWEQKSYDVNDTATFNPKTDEDVKAFFTPLPDADYLPTWYDERINGGNGVAEQAAAIKAEAHADTPTVAHLDTLGRTFLTIADNGTAGKYETRVELDIEGNQRSVTDALSRKVMTYDYDMLSNRIH
ncbi:MAG: SpvB/TcaC N-terminal domain-containing protein, partial [Nitrososphaera sp.]